MSDDSVRVGYINADRQHVLISVKRPCLTSQCPKPHITQFAIEIERAAWLHGILGEFLRQHCGEAETGASQAEVTPGMRALIFDAVTAELDAFFSAPNGHLGQGLLDSERCEIAHGVVARLIEAGR